jgi:GNAT superfamily N-acetyltransferase
LTKNTDTLLISRASLLQLDRLVPLFDGYRQFYEQPSDPAAARKYLKDRILDNSCVIFLASDENGHALGFVLLYQTWDSVDLATYWILHDLYVDQDSRKLGAGGALMRAAEEFARSVGASRLDLGTGVANTTAQSLYESLGWQRDEEFYHYSLVLAGD